MLSPRGDMVSFYRSTRVVAADDEMLTLYIIKVFTCHAVTCCHSIGVHVLFPHLCR